MSFDAERRRARCRRRRRILHRAVLRTIRMGSCSTTVATTVEKGSAVGLFGAERDGGYQLCAAPGRTEDVQVTGKRLDTVLEPD